MARLVCCGVGQKAEIVKISPTKQNISHEFILHLKKCVKCEKQSLEIIRIGLYGEKINPVRLKTANISDFLSDIHILWKPKTLNLVPKYLPRFLLNYNEYGVIKKCNSNLSSLTLGRVETDPLIDLKRFKK